MQNERNKLKLLNIEINNLKTPELLDELTQGVVVTPNIDHLIKLQKDRSFYNVYQQADYVVLDSRVIYYMLKLLGFPIRGVIPGSELFPAFYNYHKNNETIKIFLLGSMNGIAETAMKIINQKTGRNIIVGAYSPSYGFDKKPEECAKIIEMINKSGASVLAIGVGAPKQEKWLVQYLPRLHTIKIGLAIGASIDFEAGYRKRSPRWIQLIGMEWFFRFLSEPKRLWKRYFIEDLPFFKLILKQKLGKYTNPFKPKETQQGLLS